MPTLIWCSLYSKALTNLVPPYMEWFQTEHGTGLFIMGIVHHDAHGNPLDPFNYRYQTTIQHFSDSKSVACLEPFYFYVSKRSKLMKICNLNKCLLSYLYVLPLLSENPINLFFTILKTKENLLNSSKWNVFKHKRKHCTLLMILMFKTFWNAYFIFILFNTLCILFVFTVY